MKKVFLAIGNQEAEVFLKHNLDKEFLFIGQTVYREGVLINMEKHIPEILVLGESLPGKTDILKLVTEVREKYNKVRIIFIAHHRNMGDPVLAELVNKGAYDIIEGTNVNVKNIVALMRKPNEYKDVSKYQINVKVDTSEKQAPTVIREFVEAEPQKEIIEIERIIEKEVPVEIIKEVVREVVVEKEIIKEIEVVQDLPTHLKQQSNTQQSTGGFLGRLFGNGKKQKSSSADAFANKVVVFTGGKGGVGNTTLALNTAFRIAEMNRKVLYIEINPLTPAASFWYDIELKHGRGIDHVLRDIGDQNLSTTRSAITRGRLTSSGLEFAEELNDPKFVTGNIIDFMFFSAEAMEKKIPLSDMATHNFKEMFLNLFYQENYNFVIIDIPFLYNNYRGIADAFIYCHKIFTVISQDIASVGYTVKDIEELEKKDVKYKNKNTFIMNRVEPVKKLNMPEMLQWLDADKCISVPNFTDFADILVQGKPILTTEKDGRFRSVIDEIVAEL